jgi:hypothetical protein
LFEVARPLTTGVDRPQTGVDRLQPRARLAESGHARQRAAGEETSMFIQVIQGTVSDEAALRRSMDRLVTHVLPEATGHLGTTVGMCDDGTFLAVVRFESAEAAAQNNARSAQQLWWVETATRFEGDVTFTDYVDAPRTPDSGRPDAVLTADRSTTEPNTSGEPPAMEHGLIEKIKDVWHDITHAQERVIEVNRPWARTAPPEPGGEVDSPHR